MKFLILSIIFLQIYQSGNGQLTSKFDFFFGYGFYEGYNIGTEFHLKNDLHSMSLSGGYDRLINKKQESFSLTYAYNYAILRSCKNKSDKFKWHMSNRLVLWQLEDELYLWKAVSLIPSISRRFIIYKKITISFDVGPAFNIVLFNERKTFKEVGWPYHVMPNFRILFIL